MPRPMTTCPMSTCPSLTPPAAETGPAGFFRRAWLAYWNWRARRVTAMILCSLDARTLRDIGISAGEAESLVRCGGNYHRRYDAAWLWRRNG